MNKNYLTYPFRYMKITQNYNGRTSHLSHTTGAPKDYPIDEAGKDSSRDFIYCPCDRMTVKKVYGVGSSGTNTLWLQSTDKVYFADGTADFFTMLITHPNDDDMRKIRKGQTFTRGQAICREGTDGFATGNHLHISAGKGRYKGSGWTKNSKNKWVLTCTEKAEKPENLFFLDTDFTTVLSSGGLDFRTLPEEKYTPGTYRVTKAALLHVRTGPGIMYSKKKYYLLTSSARKQIKELIGRSADGYVKGVVFTVTQVSDNWGKTPSGWVCLDYCEKTGVTE